MKLRKLQSIFLAVLLALFSFGTTLACDGLPEQVTQFSDELSQAGVKIDCKVNQVVNWAVNHGSGDPFNNALKMLSGIGYRPAQGARSFGQDMIDAYRKKEGGIPKAFAGWKDAMVAVVYLPNDKQYIPLNYFEIKKNAVSEFTVKIEYDKDSNFSDADKQKIEEAVGWWKSQIADKFEITLEFHLDPSLPAGGTTLVGDVPGSCMDHQPGYAEIKLKEVNTSLVSHEIGHALGIGTAAIFKKGNVCSQMAELAKSVPDISVSSARMEGDKFFGTISKGVLMVADQDGDYGHVASSEKDDNGNPSAVQPGLGGKPSQKDIRILEDLGYEFKGN